MGRTRKWWEEQATEKQKKMFEHYRGDVRAALTSYKDGVCMGSIAGMMRECLGEDIPFREMGFNTLSEFFFHLDDILEVRVFNQFVDPGLRHKKFIFLKQSAINDSSSHIRDLVSRQATGAKRRGEPKPSYNNTVRVDSDILLPAPRIRNGEAPISGFGSNNVYANNTHKPRSLPAPGMNNPYRPRPLIAPGMNNAYRPRPLTQVNTNYSRPRPLVSPAATYKPAPVMITNNRIGETQPQPAYRGSVPQWAQNQNRQPAGETPDWGIQRDPPALQSLPRGPQVAMNHSEFPPPSTYPDKIVTAPPPPNSRVARMAAAVEHQLARDDEDEPYADDYEFTDNSSDSSTEFAVCMPGEKPMVPRVQKPATPIPVIKAAQSNGQPSQTVDCVDAKETETVKVERKPISNGYGHHKSDDHIATKQDTTKADEGSSNDSEEYSRPPEGENFLDPILGIAFDNFTIGKAIFKITEVNSGIDFTVMNADEAKLKKLKELTDTMTGWYTYQSKKKSLPRVERPVDKGLYCIYCEDTKTWRRVQVVLSEESDHTGMAQGFFMDFGILKQIQIDKLEFLKSVYIDLPRQACFAEAGCYKTNSLDYDQHEILEKQLHASIGKKFMVNITRVLCGASIVPLLTVDFVNGLQ